jgi:hypothetical protein
MEGTTGPFEMKICAFDCLEGPPLLTFTLRLAAVDVKEALCLSAGRARSWCPTGTSGSR